LDESLPNQHKTGGQSAARFGRIRDEKIGWYTKKIVELMVKYYVTNGKFNCKGLIIAGPAEIKKLVSDEELFVQYFSKHLLKTLTVSEITNQSINQVIQMAADVLTSEANDKELLMEFEQMLLDPAKMDLIVFGTDTTESLLKEGQLKEMYMSDRYINKQEILKINTKTKIRIVKTTEFASKYGGLIGIRYYNNWSESSYIAENQNNNSDSMYEI